MQILRWQEWLQAANVSLSHLRAQLSIRTTASTTSAGDVRFKTNGVLDTTWQGDAHDRPLHALRAVPAGQPRVDDGTLDVTAQLRRGLRACYRLLAPESRAWYENVLENGNARIQVSLLWTVVKVLLRFRS